ncbi:MAG: peptidoglycan DD-metalloendopeptidase family protein [bacterium]|nr:peptidoglycan DD-metalloendopeptidase family protein [bacterium]
MQMIGGYRSNVHTQKKKPLQRFLVLLFWGFTITAAAWWASSRYSFEWRRAPEPIDTESAQPVAHLRKSIIEVLEGSTFGALMTQAGVVDSAASAIYASARNVYDLATIRAGGTIELWHDESSGELKKLVYAIDDEEILEVINDDSRLPAPPFQEEEVYAAWQAERKAIPYETRVRVASGTVTSSLYAAALAGGIDERAIVELADAFQWTIDFAMDPRVGDTFSLAYEERYLNGAYSKPGLVLAGSYVNDGTPYEIFYFEETADNKGYFDGGGNAAQKIFLKAPVAFKYISSGFTTGSRYVREFSVSTGHRAIDYAAPAGTPIRAVGDGTITFAGWSTAGYGNLTSVRHNGTYSTNYAHQSRIIVKRGQKVAQGQIIGYVGSTGFSTGPHLHYEMVKYGVKINPLREVIPPGKPIADEHRERFFGEIAAYRKLLNVAVTP